ncbi:MAG: hypothetical protein LQ337_007758 [Flavoplaca oasis]|nr:MAG: hypothetical protein LQ337_007758 [Flavoplaca oasis]
MPSSSTRINTSNLKRGDYAPVNPNDLRSPCPAINALANHGYLPRDGRNVLASEILDGMNLLGLGNFLGYMFTHPIFLEKHSQATKPQSSWWTTLSHPFASAFAAFGMRDPGQKDAAGVACLNLDQLALHNVVEHDVSLTRRDFAQGDNNTPQADLIEDLLNASSNGKTITVDDFVKLRKRRYERQKADNPKLEFQGMQVQIACTEVALILKVFGNGSEVPVEYVRAFFQEGRLPREEGWSKRRWWTLGLVELNMLASKIKGLLGPPGQGTIPVVNVVH